MTHDLFMISIRNLLLVSALAAAAAGNLPRLHEELLKIWKTLRTPILLRKPAPQKTEKFWEIDMTNFEP